MRKHFLVTVEETVVNTRTLQITVTPEIAKRIGLEPKDNDVQVSDTIADLANDAMCFKRDITVAEKSYTEQQDYLRSEFGVTSHNVNAVPPCASTSFHIRMVQDAVTGEPLGRK